MGDEGGISIHALREEGDRGALTRPLDFLRFLSTPSARRATQVAGRLRRNRQISIHALREEGDGSRPRLLRARSYFYPRPPRGGRRSILTSRPGKSYFYPRPPRGGRRVRACFTRARAAISIHALREEGDGMPLGVEPSQQISIHALREEGDDGLQMDRQCRGISIHALREEGDSKNRDKISIFKQIIQHSARI